jgi:protein involved in polysaccharide export with SLBB domain
MKINSTTILRAFALLLFLGIAVFTKAQTQEALQQQAQSMIQAKGLDEAEVRSRLLQKGIDIDQVTPEQLPQLQSTIESVIKELEAEKAQKSGQSAPPANNGGQPASDPSNTPPSDKPQQPTPKANKVTVDDAKAIKEKVESGVSVEEALSEAVAENEQVQLPPAQIWGQHLFRDKSLSVFRTTTEVKPPDTYILSSGDEITVSIFGVSQFDSRFIINKEGYVQPSNMPKIFLKGIELGKAKELLRNRFGLFYRFAPEQFAVSLTTARTITVNIFGETNNYGSFTVSAINTAFNALVAAGGPSDIGSVRNIKVIRGKNTRALDVYEFMSNPALQYDFFLEDNDIIHVPVAERVVKIQGAVRRPFAYELTSNEQLAQLVKYAGGLNANAYRDIAQIKRYIDDKQVLLDVSLKDVLQGKDVVLYNGDEVTIKVIKAPIEEVVNIEGAVEQAGQYALSESPTVSSLLSKAGLKRSARRDMAFVQRKNPDGSTRLLQINPNNAIARPSSEADIRLQPGDAVVIYDGPRFTDRGSIAVAGAVRDSLDAYPCSLDSTITIAKAVTLAGGLKQEANGSGYIIRTDANNPKIKQYLPVNIGLALKNPSGKDNVALLPNDRLEVFSASDFSDIAEVSVVGAVRKGGKFRYTPTLSLQDVLILSGGLKMEAATNRVDIYRVTFTNNEPTRTKAISLEIDRNLQILGGGSDFALQPFDEVVVRNVPNFELQEFVDVNGEVQYPGRYALIDDNETLSSVIKRAGGLSAESEAEACTLYRIEGQRGPIITKLDVALKRPGSTEDHLLRPGDVITIPKKEGLVTIKGQNTDLQLIVRSVAISSGQISAAFYPGKRASWYIKEYAGGFSKDAQKRKVTVQLANGKIKRTKRILFFNVFPKIEKGATIYIPAKKTKENKPEGKKKEVDWDKKLTQIIAFTGMITSSILAYATIRSLNDDDTQ